MTKQWEVKIGNKGAMMSIHEMYILDYVQWQPL